MASLGIFLEMTFWIKRTFLKRLLMNIVQFSKLLSGNVLLINTSIKMGLIFKLFLQLGEVNPLGRHSPGLLSQASCSHSVSLHLLPGLPLCSPSHGHRGPAGLAR